MVCVLISKSEFRSPRAFQKSHLQLATWIRKCVFQITLNKGGEKLQGTVHMYNMSEILSVYTEILSSHNFEKEVVLSLHI